MKRIILSVSALGLALSTLAAAHYMSQTQLAPALEQKLDTARQSLREVKPELPEMACCIHAACNFCPLTAGKCPCGANVKTETGVCGECYDGWRAGHGHVAGVDPADVKRLKPEMVETMYKMREQHFGDHSSHGAAPSPGSTR